MKSPHAEEWKGACDGEMQSLLDAGVCEEVPRSPVPSARVVSCKWVLKVKGGADGDVEQFKARLVAQGFLQNEGIDYAETFAPVAKYQSSRMIPALAAEHNLELHQMDVKTAFLYGPLKEEVYLSLPSGYYGGKDRVWNLHRTLYGLKQEGNLTQQLVTSATAQGYAML
ncbi:hypothetical protein B9479_002234 [Cryptococcus floricola]|uniref:Reverse transcriptase Ty1/copia-type domain-containing protein n=1 Tax=Cryptococcus floricola TaxID=2591691 RepID=A0A5D3B4S0_9TREE|nr:hypothetical protein B9479_002234 [Cryptococcus floricola]